MTYYKFKNKLYLWLFNIALLSFTGFMAINFFYYSQKTRLQSQINELNSLYIDALTIFNTTGDFLNIDANDSSFQTTGKSYALFQVQKSIDGLNSRLIDFHSSNRKIRKTGKEQCISISHSLIKYGATLDTLSLLLLEKGNDKYGLQGRNNALANELETLLRGTNINNSIEQVKKNALSGVSSFEMQRNLHLLQNDVLVHSALKPIPKKKLISLIDQYLKNSLRIVQINLMLDIYNTNSYFAKLNTGKQNIVSQFSQLEEILVEKYEITKHYNDIFLVLFGIWLVAVSLWLGSYMARRVTLPINWLSNNIMLALDNKEMTGLPKRKYFFKETFDLYNKVLTLVNRLDDQEKIRRKAQRDLQASEKKYRELADMLPQSIYETDKYGKLTYVNRAWLKTFGFSENEVEKGINLIETLVSESGEGIISQTKFVHSDFHAIRKDGTTFPAVVYSNKIIKNNELTGVRGIVIDNTERKKYIELLKHEKLKAEEADRLKSSYLANMSHELRTPMNTIIGFSDLLASLDLSYNQKEEFLSHINNSGTLLLNIIDEIIDLAKIEAGEIKFERKIISANTVCTSIFDLGRGILKNNRKNENVAFQLYLPNDHDYMLFTDQNRLKQILTNLVNNAIKFTERGTVQLGYEKHSETGVLFFVKDTGIGLSPDDQNKIFERFKQVENNSIKGSGLGLTISKSLVELLGGNLWVESAPGKGSKFYFTLEYTDVRNRTETTKTKPAKEIEHIWKDKLILIAEDEDLNFKLFKEYASKTGAKVMRAYDGEEVIDICKKNNKVDVVVMDIQMPNVDGYVAILEIRKFNKSIPIIVTTAIALSGQRQKCMLAGSNEFLTKPVKKEEFLSTIEKYLLKNVKDHTIGSYKK